MMFLLLACSTGSADNGIDPSAIAGDSCDDGSYYGGTWDENQDCIDGDGGTNGYASCQAALTAYGEFPWTAPDGSDGNDRADVLVMDINLDPYDGGTRPWLAVAWETEEDPGYGITCRDVNDIFVPLMGEGVFPTFWVALWHKVHKRVPKTLFSC